MDREFRYLAKRKLRAVALFCARPIGCEPEGATRVCSYEGGCLEHTHISTSAVMGKEGHATIAKSENKPKSGHAPPRDHAPEGFFGGIAPNKHDEIVSCTEGVDLRVMVAP